MSGLRYQDALDNPEYKDRKELIIHYDEDNHDPHDPHEVFNNGSETLIRTNQGFIVINQTQEDNTDSKTMTPYINYMKNGMETEVLSVHDPDPDGDQVTEVNNVTWWVDDVKHGPYRHMVDVVVKDEGNYFHGKRHGQWLNDGQTTYYIDGEEVNRDDYNNFVAQ